MAGPSTHAVSSPTPFSTVCSDYVVRPLTFYELLVLDTFTEIKLLNPANPANNSDNAVPYTFSETGIAWPGEAKKYKPTTYDPVTIVPPPNWVSRFPDGYNSSNLPNLATDEHFQNWMRTSGLPTFSKLWGRNDHDVMAKGDYEVTVNMSMRLFSQFSCSADDIVRFPRPAV